MDTCTNCGNVDQAVKDVPTSPPEPAYHLPGRRYGERNHENETREPDHNEWSLGNVLEDRSPIEKLIKPDIYCEMKRAVKKSKQSDHSPERNEAMQASDSSERCDCDGCDNETNGPESGLIGDVGDRIRAEVPVQPIPCKQKEGCETRQKNDRFNERFPDFTALNAIGVVICFRFSICEEELYIPYIP